MVARIQVVRSGHHYRMTLERAGEIVAREVSIDRERALEIIGENPAGAAVNGRLSFDAAPTEWQWLVELAVPDLV